MEEESKLNTKMKVFGASYDSTYFGSAGRFMQLTKWIRGCTKCARLADFNVVDRIDFKAF